MLPQVNPTDSLDLPVGELIEILEIWTSYQEQCGKDDFASFQICRHVPFVDFLALLLSSRAARPHVLVYTDIEQS